MKKSEGETGEVVEQLCWDSSIDTKNIRVEQAANKIRLSGSVPFYFEKVNAFRDALNTAHGKPIINQLTVDFPARAPLPPDEMLESNIRDIVALIAWLDPEKVKVRVAGRLVYLSGETGYLWQKIRLERIIGEFRGVAGIFNDIEVKPGMDLSDNRVAGDILDSFNRISGLDPSRIGINVLNGRVFLEGKVGDSLELMAAERIAATTRGVTDVINGLRIGE